MEGYDSGDVDWMRPSDSKVVFYLKMHRECSERLLFRARMIEEEKIRLELSMDRDDLHIRRMIREVMAEIHRMKAFVRLSMPTEGVLCGYLKPRHRIGEQICDHLARRNEGMMIVLGDGNRSWIALHRDGQIHRARGPGVNESLRRIQATRAMSVRAGSLFEPQDLDCCLKKTGAGAKDSMRTGPDGMNSGEMNLDEMISSKTISGKAKSDEMCSCQTNSDEMKSGGINSDGVSSGAILPPDPISAGTKPLDKIRNEPAIEALWQKYYESQFIPERRNLEAFKKRMPKRDQRASGLRPQSGANATLDRFR